MAPAIASAHTLKPAGTLGIYKTCMQPFHRSSGVHDSRSEAIVLEVNVSVSCHNNTEIRIKKNNTHLIPFQGRIRLIFRIRYSLIQ